MNVQNPNHGRRELLELTWIEVRNERGRTRLEARWTVGSPPSSGDAVQAA